MEPAPFDFAHLDPACDQGGGDEILAGAVVQVARDPSPLYFLCPDHRPSQLTPGSLGPSRLINRGTE